MAKAKVPPGAEEVESHSKGGREMLEPVPVEEWPESFWRAFEGMPDDFERPPQVRLATAGGHGERWFSR
jgi:hypothetical protein